MGPPNTPHYEATELVLLALYQCLGNVLNVLIWTLTKSSTCTQRSFGVCIYPISAHILDTTMVAVPWGNHGCSVEPCISL